MGLGGRDAAERVYGTMVSGNYFTVLGARATHGRTLEDRDDGTPGESAVTVISHELWERRFDSDPAIVGQTILLNSHPFTVVGDRAAGIPGHDGDESGPVGAAVDGRRGRPEERDGIHLAACRVAGDGRTLEGRRGHPAGARRDERHRGGASARVPATTTATAASPSRPQRSCPDGSTSSRRSWDC